MKRAMLLAAAACVAMFALPAVASAGTWHVNNGNLPFSGTGGEGKLTSTGTQIDCSSVNVTGEYETTTTGWVEFTFHGCFATTIFNPSCTTSGQNSGTIKTTKLTFHNVLLSGNSPGILITPAHDGVFAHFTCFGLAATIHGNGLLGTVNKKCGESSATATISFNSSAPGTPEHTYITGDNKTTQYTLTSTIGGSENMASEDASGTIGFGAAQTVNCT